MSTTRWTVAPDATAVDHRITLFDVSWREYEMLLAMRGESSNPRVTYLEGALEFMSPSTHHEDLKKRLARLIEAWSEEVGIRLEGLGSWTIRNELRKRGVEPDECYFVGGVPPNPVRPDIAVEVIWTSGGLEKLDVYRGLSVPEFWIWKDGSLQFHLLGEAGYAQVDRSAQLPELDPGVIERCMAEPSQSDAVACLRRHFRRE